MSHLYSVYKDINKDISKVFSYMHTRELYSISLAKDNRKNSSFILYLPSHDAPFLFSTVTGDVRDYLTVSHHFGRFMEVFHNRRNSSAGFRELSSGGLEMLTLSALSKKAKVSDYKYLLYTEMKATLERIIYYCYLSTLEYALYSMPADQINSENIKLKAVEIATEFGLKSTDSSHLFAKDILLEPFTAEFVPLAQISALELYFIGENSSKDASGIYYEMISTKGEDYFEELKLHGLSDPFDSNFVKDILDELHYTIMGYHHFKEEGNPNET
jgi:hypothetical protein